MENQWLEAIQVRKELTDETSRIWSGMTTRQYKRFKCLKKEELKDILGNAYLKFMIQGWLK